MKARASRLVALMLLAWTVSVGMVGGCDLFRPATAEKPVSDIGIREDYSSAEATLATMARAMAAKVSGSEVYLNSLAQQGRDAREFSATFDPVVVAEYGKDPPTPWNSGRERGFFDFFTSKQTAGLDSLGWSKIDDQPDPDPTQADQLVLNRHYEVFNIIKQAVTGQVTYTRLAYGNATLTFSLVSSRWVLLIWEDHVDARTPTLNNPGDENVTFSKRRLESS